MSRRELWVGRLVQLALISAVLYGIAGYTGHSSQGSIRAGCERSNPLRQAVYVNSRIDASSRHAAAPQFTGSARLKIVRDELRDNHLAKGLLIAAGSVTLHPGSPAFDCPAAYPDPLPWP